MTASLTTIFNTALLNPGWESLLALFTLNLVSSLVVVRLIYHMAAKRRDFVFTFMLVSTAVFLLCRLLAGVEIGLAFALGLFAIFGIIRYRTNAIPIREMTYLFIVITLAVINALAPLAASWLTIEMHAMANVAVDSKSSPAHPQGTAVVCGTSGHQNGHLRSHRPCLGNALKGCRLPWRTDPGTSNSGQVTYDRIHRQR